jgi:hypothetical protein
MGRSPVTDLFGKGGRAWLARQDLPAAELETVAGCLRQIDFLGEGIESIDARLCEWVSASPEAKRLMTIPGVGVASAAALMAAIGDISRFDSSRKLVAYLGLDAKVRQSGAARCGPSPSACEPASTPGSPLSPSPARSPAFAGSYSPRKRTTPSGDPPWCARSCAGRS